MVETINQILSLLTVVSEIMAVAILVVLVMGRYGKAQGALVFLNRYGLWLAFIVALTATLGSLFYSEIAGYTPCKLCWYQRILMYPQVILLFMALWKRKSEIVDYLMGLSLVGFLIAGFHYYSQITNTPLPCSAVGYSASCSQRFFLQFGYITIPMMAASAFFLILVVMIAKKSVERK
ncbi:MAG: disulfide bond formation protein B [Patescibacteria group bacterium]|nr:disulfide bond formation protein B [Patescibacteria group bacterium]